MIVYFAMYFRMEIRFGDATELPLEMKQCRSADLVQEIVIAL
jgi:hypothetical protein